MNTEFSSVANYDLHQDGMGLLVFMYLDVNNIGGNI